MTQLTFEVEASLEARIREVAREQKITHLTEFPRHEDYDGSRTLLPWRAWRGYDVAGWPRGGPWLDDFEAAVLIADGYPFGIYEYDRWPERSWIDARPPERKKPRRRVLQVEGEGRGEG